MENNWKKWIPFWGYGPIWDADERVNFWKGVWGGFWIIMLFSLLLIPRSHAQIGYIDCSPFPSKCLIVSGKNFEETKDWLKRDTLWRDSLWVIGPDFAGNYSFTNYIDSPEEWPTLIIVFKTKPTNDLEGYLLVGHEVVHVIQFLCAAYNVDFTTEKESTAYLFEHLVTQTYNVINDTNGTNKR